MPQELPTVHRNPVSTGLIPVTVVLLSIPGLTLNTCLDSSWLLTCSPPRDNYQRISCLLPSIPPLDQESAGPKAQPNALLQPNLAYGLGTAGIGVQIYQKDQQHLGAARDEL